MDGRCDEHLCDCCQREERCLVAESNARPDAGRRRRVPVPQLSAAKRRCSNKKKKKKKSNSRQDKKKPEIQRSATGGTVRPGTSARTRDNGAADVVKTLGTCSVFARAHPACRYLRRCEIARINFKFAKDRKPKPARFRAPCRGQKSNDLPQCGQQTVLNSRPTRGLQIHAGRNISMACDAKSAERHGRRRRHQHAHR